MTTAAAAARVFVTPERKTVARHGARHRDTAGTRVGGEVRVGAQLSGIVEKLNVIVGSKIRKGDVLATIDARALEARLAQARAQIAVTAQELKRAEVELARGEQLNQQRLDRPQRRGRQGARRQRGPRPGSRRRAGTRPWSRPTSTTP